MSGARYPSLQDRVVLVTGGASGIGADMVRAFHGQGARVGFIDIQNDAGTALAEELPGSVFAACDVTDVAALQTTLDDMGKRLGPITVLVNNAANDTRHDIEEIEAERWRAIVDVNLRHQFVAARAAARPHRPLSA